jgi:hypothetical protein
MRTAYFGWETDQIQNALCKAIVPITQPLKLLGAQFSLSLGFIDGGLIDSEEYTEVLFTAYWIGPGDPTTPFGHVSFQDQVGKNSGLHGNPVPSGAVFAADILKSWKRSTVNKIVTVQGLQVPLQLGNSIVLQVGHAGLKADFECQTVLYYEQAGS